MKTELKEIKPGTGLGILKFGMDRNEVKKILGEPTEIEKLSYTDDDENLSEYWHYDELEISLNFDENYDWKLCTISLSSDEYELNGNKIVGLEHDDLLKVLKKEGIKTYDIEEFEEYDMDEEMDEVEEKITDGSILLSEEGTVTFYLEENIVTEIQLEPVVVDDEAVIWPE